MRRQREARIAFIITVLLVAVVVAYFLLRSLGYYEPPQIVGGDRDAHGCLGAAGYSYNETIGACVRQWELNSTDVQQAATTAVSFAENQTDHDNFTVTSVTSLNCSGCFTVSLDYYGIEYNVTLEQGTPVFHKG